MYFKNKFVWHFMNHANGTLTLLSLLATVQTIFHVWHDSTQHKALVIVEEKKQVRTLVVPLLFLTCSFISLLCWDEYLLSLLFHSVHLDSGNRKEEMVHYLASPPTLISLSQNAWML